MLKKEHRYTSSPPLVLHGLFWGELFTFVSLADDQGLV
jgi:hypothetical protein